MNYSSGSYFFVAFIMFKQSLTTKATNGSKLTWVINEIQENQWGPLKTKKDWGIENVDKLKFFWDEVVLFVDKVLWVSSKSASS